MVKILETTLRDGSYVVDFQFTQSDTENICHKLDSFGFDYLEVGHGLGLGASAFTDKIAYCSDEDYLRAASKAIKTGKWGVFFIPGIGNYSDLDMAISYGIKFVRIGTNINEINKGLPFIEYAKKRGVMVCANLMKSYAVPPLDFASYAHAACAAGADIVYLVDSAGGMIPKQVEAYFNAANSLGKIKLGFHGHDNLRLAIANTYQAIECGAYVVDTTLQGIGRGGGNAATEILIALLQREAKYKNLDLFSLLDFSEKIIKPLLREKGINDISLISGQGFFHSQFFPKVKHYSKKHHIDPRHLISYLYEVNILEPSDMEINSLAEKLSIEKKELTIPRLNKSYSLTNNRNITNLLDIENIISEVKMLAKKFNKLKVLNIVQSLFLQNKSFISPNIQIGEYIIASLEIASRNDLTKIMELIDKSFDIILFDAEIKIFQGELLWSFLSSHIKFSKLLAYRDSALWAKAIEDIILQKKTGLKRIFLAGNEKIVSHLENAFNSLGIEVFLQNSICKIKKPCFFDVLVGIGDNSPTLIYSELQSYFNHETLIIDGGFGSIDDALLHYAFQNKMTILRTDMRCALEAEINSKLATFDLIEKIQGQREIAGNLCVAGGLYGKEGAIVLDHINNPACILGIADGKGKVRYDYNEEHQLKINEVEKILFSGEQNEC